jgi:hypothetical protein
MRIHDINEVDFHPTEYVYVFATSRVREFLGGDYPKDLGVIVFDHPHLFHIPFPVGRSVRLVVKNSIEQQLVWDSQQQDLEQILIRGSAGLLSDDCSSISQLSLIYRGRPRRLSTLL